MGDVQEQRPSGIADTHPYLGKPGGFFGGRAGAASLRLIIFILYKNSQNK